LQTTGRVRVKVARVAHFLLVVSVITKNLSKSVSVSLGDVCNPSRSGEVKFVMPAKAGIQVRFRFKFQNRLDSGFRRNDGNKSRLSVDKFRTPRLEAEGRSVLWSRRG